MSWYTNLPIIAKFLSVAAVISVLVGAGLAVGVQSLQSANAHVANVTTEVAPGLGALYQARGSLFRAGTNLRQALLQPDADATRTEVKRVREELQAMNQGLDRFLTLPMNAEQKAAAADVRTNLKDWSGMVEEALPAIERNDETKRQLGLATIAKSQPVGDRAAAGLDKLIAIDEQRLAELQAGSTAIIEGPLRLLIAIVIAAIVLGTAAFLFMARLVANPVSLVARAMQGVSIGDLSQPIDVERSDEVGQTAASYRSVVTYLREMAGAAEAIAQGDLSRDVAPRSQADALGNAFQRMTVYLHEMAATAEAIAQGDLRHSVTYTKEAAGGAGRTGDGNGHRGIKVAPRSERDVLGVAFQRMVANLTEVTSRVNQATQQLSTATAQILTTASQHAAGANEQAAAITETASTVDELRAAAEQTAHKARGVAEQAEDSVRTSQEGAHAVDTIVDGMRNIQDKVEAIAQDILALSEQSQRIGEITATVDDIADRSNMLALNAAIEAAKAGEQGKGFAVVAAEVRNLAEQSKQATAQVRAILGDIQKATNTAVLATEQGTKRVEEGMKQAERAGAVISQLTATIRDGTQAAQVIAASAQQQSVGIDQIAQAMAHIKQGTMQFVAGARQSQSAAEDLNRLAGQLRETMERYKL